MRKGIIALLLIAIIGVLAFSYSYLLKRDFIRSKESIMQSAPSREGKVKARVLYLYGGKESARANYLIMKTLEKEMNARIADKFDLVIATSWGAVNGAAMFFEEPLEGALPTSSLNRASFMKPLAFYQELSKNLHPDWKRRMLTLEGVLAPLVKFEEKRALFQKLVGSTDLSYFQDKLAIGIFDVAARQVRYLPSWKYPSFSTADVLSAGTAFIGEDEAGELVMDDQTRFAMDGGILAYEASEEALFLSIDRFPGEQIELVVIGSSALLNPPSAVKKWGFWGWLAEGRLYQLLLDLPMIEMRLQRLIKRLNLKVNVSSLDAQAILGEVRFRSDEDILQVLGRPDNLEQIQDVVKKLQ